MCATPVGSGGTDELGETIIITLDDIAASEMSYGSSYSSLSVPSSSSLAGRETHHIGKYLTWSTVGGAVAGGATLLLLGSAATALVVGVGAFVVMMLVTYAVFAAQGRSTGGGMTTGGGTTSYADLGASSPTLASDTFATPHIVIRAEDLLEVDSETTTTSSFAYPTAIESSTGVDDSEVAICPYCGDPLGLRPSRSCRYCKTPHHRDCWEANKGCTTLGCRANPSR